MLPATGLTSCHGVHTHSFVSWRNPPAGKLSNQYAENRDISPSTGNPLLGSELPTGIQSSSGRVQLVELALLYKLCPATAGLKARSKKTETVKVHAIFQLFQKITYVTLTYNTALLSSLLTIFPRMRKSNTTGFSSAIPLLLPVHLSSSSGA